MNSTLCIEINKGYRSKKIIFWVKRFSNLSNCVADMIPIALEIDIYFLHIHPKNLNQAKVKHIFLCASNLFTVFPSEVIQFTHLNNDTCTASKNTYETKPSWTIKDQKNMYLLYSFSQTQLYEYTWS